ncbi:MarR family transcriptional regulator [Ottowia caeni]|uniref:MarR family winged helix-turn-helix transcriptional regulator n=1 Tax=Ottowia caeni TaxID=2870339 RepID=UPI001E57E348|nr:MarR family transcriptional regulator [Ottowia caeni]
MSRIENPLAQDELLLYRLYRIHATAAPLVVRMCEQEYGITRREWRILSSLVNREGVLSSELASIAMLDRARTSRNLTRLAQKNLVLRVPKPSDRREVHIYLTDEGRRLHSEVFPRIVAIQRELLAGMTGAQREQLSELLALLQAQATTLVAASPGPALPPLD